MHTELASGETSKRQTIGRVAAGLIAIALIVAGAASMSPRSNEDVAQRVALVKKTTDDSASGMSIYGGDTAFLKEVSENNDGQPQAAVSPTADMLQLQVRNDATLAGFKEVLFCGRTPANNRIWRNYGLAGMVAAARAGPLVFRLVEPKTMRSVFTKNLGIKSPTYQVMHNQHLNWNVRPHAKSFSAGWVNANFVGNAALKKKLGFSCPTHKLLGPASKHNGIYWACGNARGLHVSNGICTWTFNRRKNEYFALYYKRARCT